jgi:hypothetical protein
MERLVHVHLFGQVREMLLSETPEAMKLVRWNMSRLHANYGYSMSGSYVA